jgi:SAM-dependent methyltransferase
MDLDDAATVMAGSITATRCRVCGGSFVAGSGLNYDGMPRVAQFLPDKESLPLDQGIALEVVQCSGCGLVQLTNPPVPYYREVIRAVACSAEMMEFRARQFGGFVERFALQGQRVIEIGCGRGDYLAVLRDSGVEAFGVEHSAASVDHCCDLGLRAIQGFVTGADYRIAHAPFTAFVLLSYLEHLPDPSATLRGIHANLRDGAVGLVEVPNFDMILRGGLFAEFTSDHLLYFSAATLAAALSLNGFEVLSCDEIWRGYILSAVVRRRGPTNFEGFQRSQDRIRGQIDEYLQGFPPRDVAVWGAGHQALAMLSLMGLAHRIRYVVDAAPFKQGRYTPATHLRIVAPSALDDDPVAAVIVMAGSYSDEVARAIQERPGVRPHVCILRDSGLEHVG